MSWKNQKLPCYSPFGEAGDAASPFLPRARSRPLRIHPWRLRSTAASAFATLALIIFNVNNISIQLLFQIACLCKLPDFLRCILRTVLKNPPIVLFCHRILPPQAEFSKLDEFYYAIGHPTVDEFSYQMQYLHENHTLIDLQLLLRYFNEGRKLPPNPVALTFDDGYQDNYSYGFPVLEQYQSKGIFCLATDFIGTGAIPLHDQIIYGICHTEKKYLIFRDNKNETHSFSLKGFNNRIKSFGKIQEFLNATPYRKRQFFVENLLKLLGVVLPEDFSDRLMLNWDEVGKMHAAGHSFCAHSKSHPLLTRLETADLLAEIADSERLINEHLPVHDKVFCYPYGKKVDFDNRAIEILRKNGFVAALTAIHGINKIYRDTFQIKRTAMISEHPSKFALRTAGFFEILKEIQNIGKGLF